MTKRNKIIPSPTPFPTQWTQVWLNSICSLPQTTTKNLNYKSQPYTDDLNTVLLSGVFQEG